MKNDDFQIRFKYVPWGPIDSTTALAQRMACRRTGESNYLSQGCPGLMTPSGVA